MRQYIYFLFITIFILIKFSHSKEVYPFITVESQISNIKLNSLKALNLSLKAYSSLNTKRKKIETIKLYLKSALFFLNEASMYSPSYTINKKIDTILLRIDLFENENLKPDILSLKYEIEELKGNIINYEKVSNILNDLLQNYTPNKNREIIPILDELKEEIKLPLIDEPLENAKTFIAIAYDNVKSRQYLTAQKSIEISIDQLINLTSRANLYLVIFKDLIYRSYLKYKNKEYESAKIFLGKAKNYLLKAKELSNPKVSDIIDGFLKRIDLIYNNKSSDITEILKEYLILIQDLKNL